MVLSSDELRFDTSKEEFRFKKISAPLYDRILNTGKGTKTISQRLFLYYRDLYLTLSHKVVYGLKIRRVGNKVCLLHHLCCYVCHYFISLENEHQLRKLNSPKDPNDLSQKIRIDTVNEPLNY